MLPPSPVVVAFHKYEGLGNDFVVLDWLDATTDDEVTPARAVEICDRHRGVGADGVLLVLPPAGPPTGSPSALARMRVINSDGSRSEMCGNGVRCVALHLVRTRGAGKGGGGATVTLETDAGPRACAIDSVAPDAGSANVTVDMGNVRVLGTRTLRGLAELGEPALDLECTLADAGNPHAILFGTFARSDVERLGPRLSTNAAFGRTGPTSSSPSSTRRPPASTSSCGSAGRGSPSPAARAPAPPPPSPAPRASRRMASR